jgi:putative redox protein
MKRRTHSVRRFVLEGARMDTVRVRWAGNRQFVGWDSVGHGIVMDTPLGGKGEGSGVRPIELVLYGLAGCTAIDVISILRKKREDVRGFEINVTGEQELEDYPHYYKLIEIEYVVTGIGVKSESVARAIELSKEKYCAVGGMFGPQVKVVTTYRVEETQPTGPEGDL